MKLFNLIRLRKCCQHSFWQFHWTSGIGVAFITYMQLYILCDIGNEAVAAVIVILNCIFGTNNTYKTWRF